MIQWGRMGMDGVKYSGWFAKEVNYKVPRCKCDTWSLMHGRECDVRSGCSSSTRKKMFLWFVEDAS